MESNKNQKAFKDLEKKVNAKKEPESNKSFQNKAFVDAINNFLIKPMFRFFVKLKGKVKLPKIAKKHPIAFWVAVAFHVLLLFGLIFTAVPEWQPPEQKPTPLKEITKAVTVDLTSIEQEKKRLFDIEKKKEKRIEDLRKAEKKLENERYKEQQRLEKYKKQVKEAAKKKKATEKAIKEALLKAEKKKKATEKAIKEALLKAEKKKKATEKAIKEELLKAEKNKKVIEEKTREAEKKKKIADDKAKEAEKIRKETEIKREKEKEKFKNEQSTRELKREIQDDEDLEREIAREDILNELKINYINRIASRVKSFWRYQGAEDSWNCQVYILQDMNGVVETVNLQSCDIGDSAKAKSFRDSIERAVYKASPLPTAPDESVFDREVFFDFRVN